MTKRRYYMSLLLAGAVAGSAAVNLGTSLLNYHQQKKQFNYSKGIQQDIFEREDNSIQRRVADLQAAGLSPVLAAGQGAGTGGTVNTQAPQLVNMSDQALQSMALMTSEANLGKTEAEKSLIKMQEKKAATEAAAADVKRLMDLHDLDLAQKTGTRTHPTGIGATISDLFGVSQGSAVQTVKQKLASKVENLERQKAEALKVKDPDLYYKLRNQGKIYYLEDKK